MAYVKDKLIGRPGYGTAGPPMSGLGDDVPWYQKLLGGAATGFSTTQQQEGQSAAAATSAAIAAQQGSSFGDLALYGLLGVGLFMVIKHGKKKA